MLSIGSKEVNALYCYDKEVNHLDLSDNEVYDSNIPEYLKTFKKVTTITKDLVDSLNIKDNISIIIPKNITSIETDALTGCNNLQEMTIPCDLNRYWQNNVNCTKINKITITKSNRSSITGDI